MSKVAGFEYGIREIVRDEFSRIVRTRDSEKGVDNCRCDPRTRDGETWSQFEIDTLIESFDNLCADRAFKSGRSTLAIKCAIRSRI